VCAIPSGDILATNIAATFPLTRCVASLLPSTREKPSQAMAIMPKKGLRMEGDEKNSSIVAITSSTRGQPGVMPLPESPATSTSIPS